MAIYENVAQVKAQLETEKNREIEAITREVRSSKILPYNAEIDAAYADAVNEIQQKLADNTAAVHAQSSIKIAALQKDAADELDRLKQLGENKKVEFEQEAIHEAVKRTETRYDLAISELESIMNKYKE